jgi:hypothetical protein
VLEPQELVNSRRLLTLEAEALEAEVVDRLPAVGADEAAEER